MSTDALHHPPLMPHLRRDGDTWFVRFYWMEITAP